MLKKLPDKEYFAIDALSSSGIKQLLKTPAHYKVFSYDEAPTPQMRIGTIVHAMILGGVENIEVFDGGKTLNSASARSFIKKHPGQTIVTEHEWGLAQTIVEYQAGKSIMDWFPRGRNEVAIVTEIDGIPAKCKYDSIYPDEKMVIDIKTTSSIEHFEKSFFKFGYHIQEAWYTLLAKTESIDVKDFVFWAIETSSPFESKCYRVDEEVHEYAMGRIGEALDSYKKCKKEGRWPGYNGDIHTITLPGWLR